MRQRVYANIAQLNHHVSGGARRQILSILSLFVVLGVFWGLKLTGITMAGEAFCGMEEHRHGDSCPTGYLVCELTETEGHAHNESCILRTLICEQEETEAHTHDETCMERELVCGEEETEGHTHTDACHAVTWVCTEEEGDGHGHSEGCYTESLTCDSEDDPEHTHDADCYEEILTCGMEERESHYHDSTCQRMEADLICGQEEREAHVHNPECYILHEDTFICEREETDGHTHTEACYSFGVGFGCGMTEEEGHIHTEECLTDETELACGEESAEPHTHIESCYEELTVCPLEEHIHDESCYCDTDADLETEEDWEDSLSGVEPGISTAETLTAIAESQLGYAESTLNFEVDLHGVRRGITRYGQWYGNPYGDWSAMFASFCLHYAGVQDLPANAGPESMRLEWEEAGLYAPADSLKPQAGQLVFLRADDTAEPASELPADTAEEPTGEATDDPALPTDTAETDSDSITDAPTGEFTEEPAPEAADTLSDSDSAQYSREGNTAGAVAIITDVTENGITVIQGNWQDEVAQRQLDADDPSILGYGLVPECSPFALMSLRAGDLTYLGRTMNYSSSMFTSGRRFVLYAEHNGQYYAIVSLPASGIEPSVEAVPIQIDADGSIYAAVDDPGSLYWSFTRNGSNYEIQNAATGRYLHPGGDPGVIYDRNWATALWSSGTGAKFVHPDSNHNVGIRFNADTLRFEVVRNKNDATTLYFGAAETCTIWLDGTNGDMMSLHGSDKTSRTVTVGSTVKLPSQWKSPEKYDYTLMGWYDVKNGRYYAAGEEVVVEEELLFYADWAATSYDIGRMNADVVDTVSTSEFITTHVFDYNVLFNALSMNHNYTGGDEARWTLVENGTVNTTGKETLNFIFVDYDDPGNPGTMSYPVGRNQANGVDYSRVTFDLYNDELARLLFDTEVPVAGKHYLGLGDHLFQYGGDPDDDEHYGYFYYDSMLNAASYHQSNGRYYVYDYLERTADAANNNSYSDFLPMNSPYANTNGKSPGTYTYQGVHNEHVGTTHYSYDSKYSDSDNSPNRIGSNYWFGMAMNLEFYLPSVPGTRDSNGVYANQSIVGDDMVFEFTGDDDVWVLIDGELVLDIGGIHGVEAGSIDFSTGDVIVDGVKTGSVTDLSAGSHTLTMYYLERGSSMSNFKLRFNLSTRYSMTLRKEDALTAKQLDGAQFAVYTDRACTAPAQLWPSKAAHERGDASTNVYTIQNGVAEMWGLAPGNTYYLKEIRGPDKLGGVPAAGVVRMQLNNQGLPDYEILPDTAGNLTVGYTVHGYKVDEDRQEAYLTITNTDATNSKPTQVYVEKVWSDNVNHSGDSVTVYLIANGTDIQSVTLNAANNWRHTWENLPQNDSRGNPVVYTVREATVPGYVGSVEAITAPSGGGSSSGGGSGSATTVSGFQNGQTYLLQTRFGYLGASGNKLQLESNITVAKNSSATQWVATVNSDGTVSFTNKAGQTFYYDNYAFRASSSPGAHKNLRFSNGVLSCYIDHGGWNETQYPIDNSDVPSNVTYNGVFYSSNNAAQAMSFTPVALTAAPQIPEDTPTGDGTFYRVTNTPAGDATISLLVEKRWAPGNLGDPSLYEELSVQMGLLANGEDAGLTGTLSLSNGWSYTFTNLPKFDHRGKEIAYTVVEQNLPPGWQAEYGPVIPVGDSEIAYETTVTNTYRMTVELPGTGGIGPYGYITLGLLILLGSLGWYCGQRRKCEGREC